MYMYMHVFECSDGILSGDNGALDTHPDAAQSIRLVRILSCGASGDSSRLARSKGCCTKEEGAADLATNLII